MRSWLKFRLLSYLLLFILIAFSKGVLRSNLEQAAFSAVIYLIHVQWIRKLTYNLVNLGAATTAGNVYHLEISLSAFIDFTMIYF